MADVKEIEEIKEIRNKSVEQVCMTPFYLDGRPRFATPVCDFKKPFATVGRDGLVLIKVGKHWVAKANRVKVAVNGFTEKERFEAMMDLCLALGDMADNLEEYDDPEMKRMLAPYRNQPKKFRKECERRLAAVA